MIPLDVLGQILNAQRPCEACNACCTALAVEELGKPYFETCHHLKGNCGIYKDRPPTCKGYECAWRMGLMNHDGKKTDKKFRPDNCGFILSVDADCHGEWLEVFELKPGSIEGHERVIDETFVRIGGLQGIRVYPAGSKIAMKAATGAGYTGTALTIRNFLTPDGIHYVYDEAGSHDGPVEGAERGLVPIPPHRSPNAQDQLRAGGTPT